MTLPLVLLSLAGSLAVLIFELAARRLPALPAGWPRGSARPRVIVVQPIVSRDPRLLACCRAWLRSADAYPGRAAVVFSTTEDVAPSLWELARDFRRLDVRVAVVGAESRLDERGLDKSHRLTAAQREAEKMAPDGGAILIAVDPDVRPVGRDAVERLAAATPEPGAIASVLIPPLRPGPSTPLWQRLQHVQARSLSQILALGSLVFGRLQGMVQGFCAVVWLRDLQRLGGWDEASEYLTDDICLGVRAAREGLAVRLFRPDPALATETHGGLSAYLRQQVRWSAMRRQCRGAVQLSMLLGLPLKLPVIAGALAFALEPGAWTGAVALVALGAEAWGLCRAPLDLLLIPVEEILTFGSHLCGLLARRSRYGPWVYSIDRRSRIVSKRWVGA
jgi:hypothetical protein